MRSVFNTCLAASSKNREVHLSLSLSCALSFCCCQICFAFKLMIYLQPIRKPIRAECSVWAKRPENTSAISPFIYLRINIDSSKRLFHSYNVPFQNYCNPHFTNHTQNLKLLVLLCPIFHIFTFKSDTNAFRNSQLRFVTRSTKQNHQDKNIFFGKLLLFGSLPC